MNRRHRINLSNTAPAPKDAAESKPGQANSIELAPVFCALGEWCSLSGLSRSATYAALKEGWLPSIKLNKTRLIDFYPAIEAVRVKFGTTRSA